jgi:probable HAF family extracellular repeat protein
MFASNFASAGASVVSDWADERKRGDTNMKSRFRMLLAAITFFAGLALLFAALALPLRLAAQDKQDPNRLRLARYAITDLGTLGGTFSQAGGLNSRGSVAGFSLSAGDQVLHAFLWQRGVFTDLGTLGGPNSFTFEDYPLNDRDMVSGFSETSTPDPNGEDVCGLGNNLICLPFVWQKGVMTALPTLGGNNGIASEINNRGQVVGVAEKTTPDVTCVPPFFLQLGAVVWQNGRAQEFPPFPGDPDAVALGINDKGQAVGWSGPCTGVFGNSFHALLWENGTVTDLGNLGGATGNSAADINNQGQVVGSSDLPGDTTGHAFLWQNGVMTDLGTLPGDVSSQSLGINNQGQVVGLSFDPSGNVRGFLWQNGVMTDLNSLIPPGSPLSVLEALGINDRGQIAGYALVIATGEVHGFLATPVPGSESATPAAPDSTSERPRVTLPENVRKFLQQRRGFGRFGLGR